MLRGFGRTLRYARSWSRGSEVTVHEITIDRDGRPTPATLVLPHRSTAPLPAWIALGGVTRMGRFHPQLVRFARAMAASGAAVLVPEVDEWRELRLAPGVTGPVLRAAVKALQHRPEVRPGKVGLIGFCFGAPQAAIAATNDLADDVAGVVLFGGYFDLDRTVRCSFTGVHEWGGVRHRLSPDPFGRWVLASNYLTAVPGWEDAGEVANGLGLLAASASERRVPAWDASHDALKVQIRKGLAPRHREIFHSFAAPTDEQGPEGAEAEEIADRLATACRKVDPLLDPAPHMTRARVPMRLLHGRGDRLIPFTESLRFQAQLPEGVKAHVTVTGLFAHTADSLPTSLPHRVWERAVFFRALQGVLTTV